mmetsp:Transcript_7139/g.27335  ORF Transcript_7139/g.27335 Transcript_7139/m.27335 type:complete len:188 (-) Transcript_7139:42-605(-)|eukprot:scaffold1954_cov268-Pinguiococcus_pyrenoidosus.AAC.201
MRCRSVFVLLLGLSFRVSGFGRLQPRSYRAVSGRLRSQELFVSVGDLNDAELRESYVKGSGNGGQKINKVRNCVVLEHLPTGLSVRCQDTRSLAQNRKIARVLLAEKLDEYLHGDESKLAQEAQKRRKNKARKKAKSKKKYAAGSAGAPAAGRFDSDFGDWAAGTDTLENSCEEDDWRDFLDEKTHA